ncbi:hypothetical protein QVD17_38359 [Tagetes erecta]|uniref:Uncharacterized protein n=1 Tax=Tagetes erecta TaxID=13708 RepID=A0AAD8JQB5_TARER|nr:hypothetical protein QVD17_38359 [Tagetes erecta]
MVQQTTAQGPKAKPVGAVRQTRGPNVITLSFTGITRFHFFVCGVVSYTKGEMNLIDYGYRNKQKLNINGYLYTLIYKGLDDEGNIVAEQVGTPVSRGKYAIKSLCVLTDVEEADSRALVTETVGVEYE